MNATPSFNHDNGTPASPPTPMLTDAEVEEIVADAEFISVILEEKGARHMVGALSISLAVAFVSMGHTRKQAKEKAGEILDAALDKAFDSYEKTIN